MLALNISQRLLSLIGFDHFSVFARQRILQADQHAVFNYSVVFAFFSRYSIGCNKQLKCEHSEDQSRDFSHDSSFEKIVRTGTLSKFRRVNHKTYFQRPPWGGLPGGAGSAGCAACGGGGGWMSKTLTTQTSVFPAIG